jgi:hypothetical protein
MMSNVVQIEWEQTPFDGNRPAWLCGGKKVVCPHSRGLSANVDLVTTVHPDD